jgi:hypothetical protein
MKITTLSQLFALSIIATLPLAAQAADTGSAAPPAASSTAAPAQPIAPLDCDMRHMDMSKMTMEEHMKIMQACRQQQKKQPAKPQAGS